MNFNFFLLIFFYIFQFILSSYFSGFYHALKNEEYGGAFLVSKERFINSSDNIHSIWYPEGVILSIIHRNHLCINCNTLFLRDYFDFSSDHLSSTTNIVGTMPMETQKHVLEILNNRLDNTVKDLSRYISNSTQRKKVVAVIPYSGEIANPGSNDPAYLELHQKIRRNFFKATFFSIYRYFANIMVYVASKEDYDSLISWNLPVRQIYNLDDILSKVPKENYFFINHQRTEARPRNQLLPKYTLLSVLNSFKNDESWSSYKYIYYTEGDQILHLRKIKLLLRAIDARGGKDILVPHRMQTLPLYQNIPESASKGWNYQKLTNVNLITETNSPELGGSCCDNGRFNFPDCHNWWYYCTEYGVKNHTVWLQFGADGFTMPLSTEHQGVCSYTPNQILCPIPCQKNSLSQSQFRNRYNTSFLCGEMDFSIERQTSYSSIPPIETE